MRDLLLILLGALLPTLVATVESKYHFLQKRFDDIHRFYIKMRDIFKFPSSEKNVQTFPSLYLMHYFDNNNQQYEEKYYQFYNELGKFCNMYKERDDYKWLQSLEFNQLCSFFDNDNNHALDFNLFILFEKFSKRKEKYESQMPSKLLRIAEKIMKKNIDEIQHKYMQLNRYYNEFLKDIRSEMHNNNFYPDKDSKKLDNDIRMYEAHKGYWESSNKYIDNIIQKKISSIRKKTKKENLRILDIGGGDGSRICKYIQNNDMLTFIEPDNSRIEEAKKKLNDINNNITYIEQRFEDIVWKKNCKYDVIVCSHVIQHVTTDNYLSIVEEIKKLLDKSGLFFLLCPLAFSKYNEFVVHGLEFDLWRIDKKGIEKPIKIDIILEKCNLENLNQFAPQGEHMDNYIVYRNFEGDDIQYALREEKDCYLLYHRAKEGLIASFARNNTISDTYDEVSKYLGFNVQENSKFTWYSRQWQIDEKKLAVLDTDTQKVSIFEVKETIENHYHYNEQIVKNWEIPAKFCDLFESASELILLPMKQENRWGIYKGSTYIASIIKTQNHFFLIDNRNLKDNNNSIAYDDFKSTYSNFQFMDSEFQDGLIISGKNSYEYFLRFDNDWLRLFKGSCMANGEIEPLIFGNLTIWKGNGIQIECAEKNYIWNIRQLRDKNNEFFPELPNPLLPDYNVLRITNEKYFIYRDKRYTRLCEESFNKLCNEEADQLKILPTHHFVRRKIVEDLKQKGLKQVSFFSYHLGAKLKIWGKSIHLGSMLYPKSMPIFLRDRVFNFLRLNRFRCFRKKFEARDCLFILKKDS